MSPRLFRPPWLALVLALWAGPVAAQPPCPDPPIYPPTRGFVQPPRPCPDDDVRILFATCAPCWDIVEVSQGADGITVRTVQHTESCIPTVCLPESTSIGIGRLAAGHHEVVVRFVTDVRVGTAPDTAHCTFTNVDTLRFDVTSTCAQNTLPYVKEVVIGEPSPCLACPPRVCANDSIPVLIRGEFTDNCIALAGVQLIPSRSMSPLPTPPTLRIVYETNDCIKPPCALVTVPWEAKVMLPPLPALTNHVYSLQVEAALRSIQCTGPPDSTIIGEAQFPFAVSDACTTSFGACFLTSFDVPLPDGRVVAPPTVMDRCDAILGPGQPAYATFRIGSGIPIFGIEGRFVLEPPQAAVTGIETVGAATGMRLAWQPTSDGAKFVLFSDGSAFIPSAPPLPSYKNLPILRVRVELRASGGPPPGHVWMRADNLLASDASGNAVSLCPIMFLVEPYDWHTVFCTGQTCDFDGNGTTDVRDLVRMVRCLEDTTRCDVRHADCNGDGSFDLNDVFCCARVLLGGGPADTTGGRADPSLSVRFGAPVAEAGSIAIPVSLAGANPVGGARLVLRFPGDRFDVAGVEFPEAASTWLGLHDVQGGRVTVGLLALGASSSAFHQSFTLRLTPRAGQRSGGELTLETAEFSDPNGIALRADLGSPSVVLGGGRLALGSAHPNPFGREVEFAVTLAENSDLEVSVHDLTGRLVTTLHRGPAPAGGYTFRWDGRDTDGSRAAAGIYFYRARAFGETLSQKLILLRER